MESSHVNPYYCGGGHKEDGYVFTKFDIKQVPPESSTKKLKKDLTNLHVKDSSEDIDWLFILFIVSTLFAFQAALAVGSYSGEGKPPMFGDFEAQRHWMEITYHLPVSQWYVNSTDNNLLYWGLDYPPLTAYHSYLMGIVAHYRNSTWVALHDSRGLQSDVHKLFMRLTAVIPYPFLYIPAVLAVVSWTEKSVMTKGHTFALSVLYPGLIAIDNAHFQYNSISLGLFLLAYAYLITNRTLIGSIFFVIAVNYKQMELYHALPIFVFILARCLKRPLVHRLHESAWALLRVALVVLVSFAILWFPFFQQGTEHVLVVLRRIFPFYRGIYEDKVASFWCAFSFVLKLNRYLNVDAQIKVSTLSVLFAAAPSLCVLFLRPTVKNFRLSLFLTSLSFFLFSFQVHEKSILLPAIASLLLLAEQPHAVLWFLNISNTSMFSLCIKDENHLLLAGFVAYFLVTLNYWRTADWRLRLVYISSCVVGQAICVAEWVVQPPPHLPHIFPLLNAVYSCLHFLLFLFYFYYQLLVDKLDKTKVL